MAQWSGVTFYPAGATFNDSITIIVNTFQTCPTSAINSTQSLAGTNVVRIHAGLVTKRNGVTTTFRNVVNANGATVSLTTFTAQANGTFSKKILPSSYFSTAGFTTNDTITGFSFVLNGGARAGFEFDKVGKLCNPNGSVSSTNGGDFIISFPVPGTNPRLNASLTLPTTDTTIAINSPCNLRAFAFDTTGQSIEKINYWVNGVRYDSTSVFPYNLNFSSNATGTYTIQAQVKGVYGIYKWATNTRTITVSPTPRLAVSITSPISNSVVRGGTVLPISISAFDTTLQNITKVILWVNGVRVDSTTTAPYNFNYALLPQAGSTYTIAAEVIGAFNTRQVSNAVSISTNGSFGTLGSGVVYSPANPTADSLITFYVTPSQTCARNGETNLAAATIVRIHSGVTLGIAGTAFQRTVNASGATATTTVFTKQNNSIWTKSFVPRNYYGLAANDSVYAVNFVLNGGATGSEFSKVGRVCGTGVDFKLNLDVPLTSARLFTAIEIPSADTSVLANSVNTVRVSSFDSTGQRVSKVVLYQDGNAIATSTSAPYRFSYTAPAINGAYTLQAESYGVRGALGYSSIRTLTVTGGFIVPRLNVAITSPVNNAVIKGGSILPISVSAFDSTSQTISKVVLWVDGRKVDSSTVAPYSFNYLLPFAVDTLVIQAQAFSVAGPNTISEAAMVYTYGTFRNLGSGVVVSPANPTSDSSITFYVTTSQTCGNPNLNLSTATKVRIHSGVQIGLRSTALFDSTVSAGPGATTQSRTEFTRLDSLKGVWSKTFVPRSYYNLRATDSIYSLNFVLNGGVDANPWTHQGKVCGTGALADFKLPLVVPITPGRLSVSITRPSIDTNISVNNSIAVNVSAFDTTGQRIDSVNLWANGVRIAKDATAPYSFIYTAPATNGTVSLQAKVYGIAGGNAVSSIRNLNVSGQIFAPRLAVSITSIADNDAVAAGTALPVSVFAVDSTNQAISKVILWVDGRKVDSSAFGTNGVYSFNYFLAPVIDTISVVAQVIGANGASLISRTITFRTTGSFANLGSGIIISPANATADSTLTVYLNAAATCPIGDLNNSTKVRIHAGVQKGLNGTGFQNTVSAAVGATQISTELVNRGNKMWTKTFVPRAYFGLNATDSVYAMNFVLNGGPNATPWDRSAKVCGTLGDFRFALNVPITPARLVGSITLPSVDTTVRVNTNLTVKVAATDSTGQAVRKIVLYANGLPIDSITRAPFNFAYTASGVNGITTIQARVFGIGNVVLTTNTITITTTGQIFPPRLFGSITSPSADTTIGFNTDYNVSFNGGDSVSTQSILGVRLKLNGTVVNFTNNTSGTFVLKTPAVVDTSLLTIEVLGQNNVTLTSATRKVISNGVNANLGSGVYIYPAVATADSLITITVYPTKTCPTLVANASTSLANASIVRIHSGVQIGIIGAPFQRTVNAQTATISLTEFTYQPNGTWTKSFVPRAYYGLNGTDSVYAINFVLNGGPANNPFGREGKVCGNNGQAGVGAAGNFNFGLNVPITLPRLAVAITQPTADTIANVGSSVQIRVSASDSSGLPISKVILWANGRKIDSTTNANYTFNYITPLVVDTIDFNAQVIGNRGSNLISNTRTIITQGLPVPARLAVNIASPSVDTIVRAGDTVDIAVSAIDTTGQAITSVSLYANGVRVASATTAPYRFSYITQLSDVLITLQAKANSITGDSLLSTQRIIRTTGSVLSLTSGVSISPVSATADDTLTITVNTTQTCAPSGFSNLAGAGIVRLHAGVKLSRNGGNFDSTVSAAPGVSQALTTFTNVGGGIWVKKLLPRTYFNLAPIDSVIAMSFVLNGGADATPWTRQAKRCVTGADFTYSLNIKTTLPQLSISIASPSVDTTVGLLTPITVKVAAMDTSANRISKVILWADGVKIDSARTAPYQFNYLSRNVADTVQLLAQVIGARGASLISAPRTIITEGVLVPARIAVNITNPANDTTVRAGNTISISVIAVDSSSQVITGVSLFANDTLVSTMATPPYNFNYATRNIDATSRLVARATSITGTITTSTIRVVRTVGSIVNLGSGVIISPSNATADDSITITVNTNQTCAPAGSASLSSANVVRIHAGVQIGRSGSVFQNTVSAGPGATQVLTEFTNVGGGIWIKKLLPRTYFSLQASDSAYAMNFVFNGGANATPWTSQAKVCGTGADFRYALRVIETPTRLGITITSPSQDTAVQVGTLVNIRVSATDSSGQAIRKVILWANGRKVDSLSTAPYNFTFRAPSTNTTTIIAAQAIGARGASIISSSRSIVTQGQLIPARIAIALLSPSEDTTVRLGARMNIRVAASDTTGQDISSVRLLVDGLVVATSTAQPFNLTWTAPPLPDTIYMAGIATSVTGETRLSSAVRVIVGGGSVANLGSGVYMIPANPSADEEVTIVVNTAQTCPTAVANPASTLASSTQVRLHSGVTIGRNGVPFQRVVNASGATIDSTNFIQQSAGVWAKTFIPRRYFGLPASDSVYALNFVLNGGPSSNPFAREGKVCGNNGQPATGAAGDFNFNLRVDLTQARLSGSIVNPRQDTIVDSLAIVRIQVVARDSSNQAIRKVVLLANGRAIDSLTNSPYNFSYRANTVGTFVLTAKVVGANNTSIISNSRSIQVRRVLGVSNAIAGEIMIAPNPTTNWINVQSNKHEINSITVVSLHGQVLMEEQVKANTTRLDVSSLPAGAYLLRIETKEGIGYARVIKQ